MSQTTENARLVLYPADEGDGRARDFLQRAHRLGLSIPERPAQGEHVMNPHPPVAARLKDAAVLLALAGTAAGAPVVVFTERAGHLSAHAGQVALPGGKIEPGESAVEAALREAEEEVSLHGHSVEPIALTEPYITRTGFSVVPVIAAVRRPATLLADPAEVSGCFTVPLDHLFDLANHREVVFTHAGQPRRTTELTWQSRRIWGVTAGILRLIHERLYTSS